MNKRNEADTLQTVWLSLGSNLGDRLENLIRGMGILLTGGLEFADCSGIYETDPVGFEAQPPFYNLVLKARTSLLPHEILALCHQAEKALGRERKLRWGPRTLDVDILLIGERRLSAPDLEVPHPRMKERAFVLGPLEDMDPEILQKWGFPSIRNGIDLKISASDVRILLQQNGWLS